MKNKLARKTCENGHVFYKSSDCPSCPACEAQNKPESGFLSRLSSPARGALIHEGITTLEKLSEFTEKEIIAIHGIGPASMPTFRQVLKEKNLVFKKK